MQNQVNQGSRGQTESKKKLNLTVRAVTEKLIPSAADTVSNISCFTICGGPCP